MSREKAGIMIIVLDWLIMLVVAIGIIRLRWYEAQTINDMKNKKLKIEDFSVYLPNIPIAKDLYNNNPDLLCAQLAVHLEDVIHHELQAIPELEEI
jgi:hypothetical protein